MGQSIQIYVQMKIVRSAYEFQRKKRAKRAETRKERNFSKLAWLLLIAHFLKTWISKINFVSEFRFKTMSIRLKGA